MRPDGTSFNVTTTQNGEFALPFEYQGQYTVELVQSGASIKTHVISVGMAPPVAPQQRPTVVEEAQKFCWVLPALVAVLVAYLAYRWLTEGGGRRPFPPKK